MICHLTTRSAWEKAIHEGGYQPPSLSIEGFIHCSYPEQVEDTAWRYFRGQTGLVLLWIEPGRLTSELRIEDAAGHAGQYPHIYGPLNPEAVVRVTEYPMEP